MPRVPEALLLSVPEPEVCRSSCQYATAAMTRSPTSAPARSGAGRARALPRSGPAALSEGTVTASAQPTATATATSHTPRSALTSSRSPIRDRAPQEDSSRISGPARSGAHTAAGSASSSASMAASEVTRAREPPRARSIHVSPARSVLSSRATSSSVYVASRTSCSATMRSVERETSRARSARSRVSGSEVVTPVVPARAFSCRSALVPSRALVRSLSMSDVVTDEKSADASQADFPAETR